MKASQSLWDQAVNLTIDSLLVQVVEELGYRFPNWCRVSDYQIDEFGQTRLYWRSGGKRKKEAKEVYRGLDGACL